MVGLCSQWTWGSLVPLYLLLPGGSMTEYREYGVIVETLNAKNMQFLALKKHTKADIRTALFDTKMQFGCMVYEFIRGGRALTRSEAINSPLAPIAWAVANYIMEGTVNAES